MSTESDQLMNQLGHESITQIVYSWFDRCTCLNCGLRLKSKKEVYQTERDECCVYACTSCDEIVEEEMLEEIEF
jgi:hypothetical protein